MLSTHLESVLKAVVVILCYVLKSTDGQDFSYDGTLGPDHWGEQYNGCSGKFQSPININLLEVQNHTFDKLILEGFLEEPIGGDIVNNGHTVVVRLNYEGDEPTIGGGPLGGTFRFAQLHFHWGDNDTYGSEDRINNQSFPAELHVVFYNTKYDSFNSAVGHSEGVAVMAFFFSLQSEDNPNYSDLAFLLSSLQEPDHYVPFLKAPTLRQLASIEYDKYFTYIGSLTTPPCSEEVLWIDFEDPIMISRDQIDKFRHLYTHDGLRITHNFRPIQPLNGRVVKRHYPRETPDHIDNENDEYYNDASDEQPTPSSVEEKSFTDSEMQLSIPFRSKKKNSGPVTNHGDIWIALLYFLVFI